MFRKTAISFAATLLLALSVSIPVQANHCPADARKIDQALKTADISDEKRAAVVALRDEGMSLHDSGEHSQSLKVLAKAKRLLNEPE